LLTLEMILSATAILDLLHVFYAINFHALNLFFAKINLIYY